MSINALPDPPSRSDPANFPERADAFMAALPQFATEANVLQQQVNEAAAAADDYKDSAASSASAASGSAANALLSETHAQLSATGAAQARTDSETARDVARDWAAKPGGDVAGTGLLSAFQYAQMAAAGSGVGLPQYPASAIPASSVGDIWIIGVGPMSWNGSRYVSTQYASCGLQLQYVSASQIAAVPYTSNLVVINGRVERLSAATVLAVTGLVVGQVYNIYIYKPTATTFALEASTVARALGSDGIYIKSGDGTRTLLGKAYVASGPAFAQTGLTLGVISWYHRLPRFVGSNVSSSTYANTILTTISANLNFLAWGDSPVQLMWQGYSSCPAGVSQYTYMCMDSVSQAEASVTGALNTQTAAPIGGAAAGLPAEGFRTMQLRGNVTSAANSTISCNYGLIIT